jgi:serine protease Do
MKLYLMLCLMTVTVKVSSEYRNLSGKKEKSLDTCTGVFVSENEVLTADHCVKDSTGKQWIKNKKGQSFTAIVERRDSVHDLALLKVYIKNKNFAHLGKQPEITDKVYSVNSGNDLTYTWDEGVVENIMMYEETDPSPIILSSFHIMPGASGGGLFNSKGELVGINVATILGGSLAVNTPDIRTFLAKLDD